MSEYNIDRIRNNKRYMIIITSEDDRYTADDEGYNLWYWEDHPYDGVLEDVVFVDTADELFDKYPQHEGLFYQTYDLNTGKRIAYGAIEFNMIAEELEENEEKEANI